jgi:hypothetical protein
LALQLGPKALTVFSDSLAELNTAIGELLRQLNG